MTWQPIETAPYEGDVLVYSPDAKMAKVASCLLRGGRPFVVNGVFAWDWEPVTHWMPLPSPPEAEI
jgi:hypothetical protein